MLLTLRGQSSGIGGSDQIGMGGSDLPEYALKHGIDKQMEGGLLDISVKKEKDRLIVKIKNPGELKIEGAKGIGLKNLRDRLQLKYKGEAQFEIREIAGHAVLATLILPISE